MACKILEITTFKTYPYAHSLHQLQNSFDEFQSGILAKPKKILALEVQSFFCLSWAFVQGTKRGWWAGRGRRKKPILSMVIIETKPSGRVQWTMINDHSLVAIKHRTHKFFFRPFCNRIYCINFLYRFFLCDSVTRVESVSIGTARDDGRPHLRPTTTAAHYWLERKKKLLAWASEAIGGAVVGSSPCFSIKTSWIYFSLEPGDLLHQYFLLAFLLDTKTNDRSWNIKLSCCRSLHWHVCYKL